MQGTEESPQFHCCSLCIVCVNEFLSVFAVLLPQGNDVTGLAVVLPTCMAVLLEVSKLIQQCCAGDGHAQRMQAKVKIAVDCI